MQLTLSLSCSALLPLSLSASLPLLLSLFHLSLSSSNVSLFAALNGWRRLLGWWALRSVFISSRSFRSSASNEAIDARKLPYFLCESHSFTFSHSLSLSLALSPSFSLSPSLLATHSLAIYLSSFSQLSFAWTAVSDLWSMINHHLLVIMVCICIQ